MGSNDPERWAKLLATFMDRADSVGVTGRRFVLCFLAVLAGLLMIWGIKPLWAIVFVVVLYILEPAVEIGRTLLYQRRASGDLTDQRSEFRRFVARRRHQSQRSEPELPLSLPRRRQNEDGEDQ